MSSQRNRIGRERSHSVSANNQYWHVNRCDPKFEFSQKLSSFGYSNTNETVYFIEITGITDATGESNRNLNGEGKLNMCSLESRKTSSTLDHNLSVAYLDFSLKTCRWCSNSSSSPSLIPLSLSSPKKKHRRLFWAVIIRSPSMRH